MLFRSFPMSSKRLGTWILHRQARGHRWQEAVDIAGAHGTRLCRFAHLHQPARFISEPAQRINSQFLEGLELALYIRFVLRKALGDAQDLCAERGRNTHARHGQYRNRNEHRRGSARLLVASAPEPAVPPASSA